MTPLAWHAFSGNVSIINLLLDHDANINDNFDAMYHPEIKVTVANVAESLIGKKAGDESAIEDKFMQTYLAIKRRGGVVYSQTKAAIAEKLAAESGEAESSETEQSEAGNYGVEEEL